MNEVYENIIIGAGGAGLMAAVQASYLGKRVLILEQNTKIGLKILASGGGRCNYTNIGASEDSYLSQNPHFSRSVLSSWPPADTIDFFEQNGIVPQEKKLGQIFPLKKDARDVLAVFKDILGRYDVPIYTSTKVVDIEHSEDIFRIVCSCDGSERVFLSKKLVIASGGLSYPKIGVSNLAYVIARKLGMKSTKVYPGLVPFALAEPYLELAGVSLLVKISLGSTSFTDDLLFTHMGLSGPAVLQISSYWRAGEEVVIDFLPSENIISILKSNIHKKRVISLLNTIFPQKMVKVLFKDILFEKDLGNLNKEELSQIERSVHHFRVLPKDTLGFGKAEISVGGVDTDFLHQKTLESKLVKGLYFCGEAIDVSGWLGGYNFQWAFASAVAVAKQLT